MIAPSAQPPPPGLDALLQALRARGLPLGAREVLRLQRVFAAAPALDQERPERQQLRDLLACALVHSPAERRRFDEVFEPWAERWTAWGRRRPERQRDEPAAVPRRRRWRRLPRRILTAGGLVVLALALAVLAPPPYRPAPVVASPEPLVRRATLQTSDDFEILSPGAPPTTFTEWLPTLTVVPDPGRPSPWRAALPAMLGLGLLAAAAALWRRYLRHPWLPEPLPAPLRPGPERLPLLPTADVAPELLAPRAAQTLVWGVERHVSDDLTAELDLPATVAATARAAGLPRLCYQPDRRLREVWLWLDGTVEDPALERYAAEIAASLERAGLPVRVGGFDGDPAELTWDTGQAFRPQEQEAHRQTALVAVLTDGAVLLQHRRDARGRQLAALLRSLVAWPRLTFVDFGRGSSGRGPSGLASYLARFSLACVRPEALPAFFGLGSTVAPSLPPVDPAEVRAWRAALAFGPRPADRAGAAQLRRQLGLRLSAWSYPELLAAAADGASDAERQEVPRRVGGKLRWSAAGRLRLVNWLVEGEARRDGGLQPAGLVEQTLAFWDERLAEEQAERRDRGVLETWEERPAQRFVQMERALLRLWRQPREAAEELFELSGGELGQRLARELGRLEPWDAAGSGERLRLPWRFRALDDRTRYLLAELGLGGVTRGELRKPGRLAAGLGALLSLGLVLIGQGLWSLRQPGGGGEPVIEPLGPQPPAEVYAFSDKTQNEAGRWTVLAGTPRGRVDKVEVGEGQTVRLAWASRESACFDGEGEAQLWRCGVSPRRPMTREVARDWPLRSIAVVLASANDDVARSLAAALIDGGTADQVLLGVDAANRLPEIAAAVGQWLVVRDPSQSLTPPAIEAAAPVATVTTTDLQGLEPKLVELQKIVPVREVWSPYRIVGAADAVRVSDCPRLDGEHPGTGMRFVRLCGGTFRMGSEEEDPRAEWDDEKPAHDVTVSGFWAATTEVTGAQYRVFQPQASGEANRPVVEVNWQEARSFCQSLGGSGDWSYDLPTEAEWEYAARAGTNSARSFGDDEDLLEQFAWFAGNSEGTAHDVADLDPNPWGLFDVHGNVWEWVLDCWDEELYRKRAGGAPIVNPLVDCQQSVDSLSTGRVIRGGSFRGSPRNVRSAFRVRFQARGLSEDLGFRCVRVSSRPP